MVRLSEKIPWTTFVFTFNNSDNNGVSFQAVVSDVASGAWWSNVLPVQSGADLTFTRASWGGTGTVGSGASGALPTSVGYFGFGSGASGATFNLSSVSWT